jgi:hypothetical protein
MDMLKVNLNTNFQWILLDNFYYGDTQSVSQQQKFDMEKHQHGSN